MFLISVMLLGCSFGKNDTNKLPKSILLVDSLEYNIQLESKVINVHNVGFETILTGKTVCDINFEKYKIQELKTGIFKDLKLVSLYDSQYGESFETYQNQFLKEYNIFYLGTQSFNNITMHLIMSENKIGDSLSVSSSIYLLVQTSERTYCIVLGACLNGNSDTSIISGTKFENGKFTYYEYLSQTDAICQEYHFSNGSIIKYNTYMKFLK